MDLIDAILLGAGTGTRYSLSEKHPNQTPKQFQFLEGKPVFIWALNSLVEQTPLRRVLIVVAPDHLQLAKSLLAKHFVNSSQLIIDFVAGGKRRQDSSLNAIRNLKDFNPWPDTVLIHDACRPFIGNTLIQGLKSFSQQKDVSGWIPGLPVLETIKQVSEGIVTKTVDRSELRRVQTPQLFKFDVMVKIMEQIHSITEIDFTDDASVLEHFGERVAVFSGDERNIKLTYETDAQLLIPYLKTKTRNLLCESEPDTTFTV